MKLESMNVVLGEIDHQVLLVVQRSQSAAQETVDLGYRVEVELPLELQDRRLAVCGIGATRAASTWLRPPLAPGSLEIPRQLPPWMVLTLPGRWPARPRP